MFNSVLLGVDYTTGTTGVLYNLLHGAEGLWGVLVYTILFNLHIQIMKISTIVKTGRMCQ